MRERCPNATINLHHRQFRSDTDARCTLALWTSAVSLAIPTDAWGDWSLVRNLGQIRPAYPSLKTCYLFSDKGLPGLSVLFSKSKSKIFGFSARLFYPPPTVLCSKLLQREYHHCKNRITSGRYPLLRSWRHLWPPARICDW